MYLYVQIWKFIYVCLRRLFVRGTVNACKRTLHAYVHVYVYTQIWICIYIYMYTYKYEYLYIYVYDVYLWETLSFVEWETQRVCLHVFTFTYIYVFVSHTGVHLHVFTFTYVDVCVYDVYLWEILSLVEWETQRRDVYVYSHLRICMCMSHTHTDVRLHVVTSRICMYVSHTQTSWETGYRDTRQMQSPIVRDSCERQICPLYLCETEYVLSISVSLSLQRDSMRLCSWERQSISHILCL